MSWNCCGHVQSVSVSLAHGFSKPAAEAIRLLAGRGVEGDAHCGVLVRHRSRVQRTPGAPNLRQVHLLQSELLGELRERGFTVAPGNLGENVTTAGVALLDLPRGSRLKLGGDAEVAVTGLRNPCAQLDAFAPGLMAAVLDRAADGSLIRRAGVMAVVVAGGLVRPGDVVRVWYPDEPWEALGPV